MTLRMERIVPLIGPTVVGPLGVAHLPRMWLKAALNSADALTEGYFPHYFGFNRKVVDGLGLDPEAFFGFLGTLPTYAETERWVREHATRIDPAGIAAVNIDVASFQRPEEPAAAVRARVGLDQPGFRLSQALISLDDWCTMHEWLLAHRGEVLEPIIPTVSSSTTGPLGIPHLPRLWMKATLTAVKALPEGWNSGFGFDKFVSDTIGLDLDAACAYIHAELPTYLQFEGWVTDHLPAYDEMTKWTWNGAIRGRQKGEEKAAEERAEAGVPELNHREAIMLNDMVDWTYLHERAVERRAARA
jgi:hypothetical protein